MTLNITLLTPAAIYQSADFRLTNSVDGSTIVDDSPKSVIFQYDSLSGFVTYTGIGSWGGLSLSGLIADWLVGPSDLTLAEVAAIVEHEGTNVLKQVHRATGQWFAHTFTVAGFEDNCARAFVVSNFEDCFGQKRTTIDEALSTTRRELNRDGGSFVIVTGQADTVPSSERKILRELAIRDPSDGGRIRRRMKKANAEAAKSTRCNGTVSDECAVTSFRSDGYGILQLGDDPDHSAKQVPMILNGVNFDKTLTDLAAAAGLDMSGARLETAAFVSTTASGPLKRVRSECRFEVSGSGGDSGYRIREIRAPRFEPQWARGINELGEVVGTGRSEQKPHWQIDEPWMMKNGELFKINFSGNVWGINGAGHIIMDAGGPENAIYMDGSVFVLPIEGPDVDTVGASRGSGIAINNRSQIGGAVCADTGYNMHAAVFQRGATPSVLVDASLGTETRAVDLNDVGQVLVIEHGRPASRSIIWNLDSGTWEYVGGEDSYITPVTITNDGVVVGVSSEGLAMACLAGESWRPLGTGPGWSPTGINDKGDVIGIVMNDGLFRPWLRLASDELILLPYVVGHHTEPTAINSRGEIVGTAQADHGGHAVIWSNGDVL
ncbi:hypothetical protein [Jongsikchunia kroppenstedtii]|uniref:hypothetical protein n=1 Tax=Jongsikchunia kroppenstedtii TaxID=1121721 RepID=UPI0003AA79A3|nr:hypothetical protein [Jongsikchunia kroppenstedtii]